MIKNRWKFSLFLLPLSLVLIAGAVIKDRYACLYDLFFLLLWTLILSQLIIIHEGLCQKRERTLQNQCAQ